MLHARLHGKLDDSTLEPERLEDALTSTVFGTLVWVGAWDILARWLGVSSALPSSQDVERECWFWPRLARAVEPDVVLRLGDTLVVVEAKYRSGRHDRVPANDVEDDPCDQLHRQYLSVKAPQDSRALYADSLERAIRDCRLVQAFVVDGSRRRRAQRERDQSEARLPPGACLRLVTWQSLFSLLSDPGLPPSRWSADLRTYLELVGLNTFEGIGRRATDDGKVPRILRWRARPSGSQLQHAVVNVNSTLVATLRFWGPSARPARKDSGLLAIDRRVVDGSASRAIVAWRALSRGLVGITPLPRRK